MAKNRRCMAEGKIENKRERERENTKADECQMVELEDRTRMTEKGRRIIEDNWHKIKDRKQKTHNKRLE